MQAQVASGPATLRGRAGAEAHSGGALRWAGAGGLVFAVTIIVQNIIRATTAPPNDSSPATVAAYFAQHLSIEWALVVLFTLGGFGLTLFAGGVWARSVELDPGTRPWAMVGVLGVAGIVAVFSGMMACEVALMTAATQADLGDLGVQSVAMLWILHNATFSVLTLSIAIALLGFSQAGARSGLTHSSFRVFGLVGACLLAFNTAVAPLIAGTNSPIMAVGLVGFLCWIAFIIVAGYKLARG